EFTKRKNWSHRVIGQLPDLYYVLTSSGTLMYCSPSSLELTGYPASELVGKSMVEFLHVDDIDLFVGYLKESVDKGSFRFFYRFRRKDSTYIIFEVVGHPYPQGGPTTATTPKCFFNLARLYPLHTTSVLDTFLQLRLENEALYRSVQQLRSELDEADGSVQDDDPFEPDASRYDQEDLPEDYHGTLGLRGGMEQPTVDLTHRVCAECGTTNSPEWRKGPSGAKTLCNACGLRWSKKSRR
ncbi:hypothetical protein K493DRAFT_150413, partial [Basidiobolus meristosporus CBS 931.73]